MTAAAGAPRRSSFATSDPDLVRETLDEIYGARLGVNRAPDGAWHLSFRRVDERDFAISEITLPGELTWQASFQDVILVNTVRAGTAELERGKITERYQPGDTYVGSQPRPGAWHGTCRDLRAGTVLLPVPLLSQAAGELPGHRRPAWSFLFSQPVPAASSRQWQRAARYADDLLASPLAAASPLLVTAASHLLAATALALFPSTAGTALAPAERHDAHPGTLHRATTFIDDNAHKDITITDIAAAARVTPRAIQLAFRRHLDTTPTAYLRRVRLDHAHRELQEARPGQATVTAVAYRWGFPSSSRFSAYYRQAYGVPPTRTLEG